VRPTPPNDAASRSKSSARRVSSSARHVNIDAADESNPQACTNYVNEIYAHFRNTEGIHGPQSNYMSFQKDINEKMRAILFDWLVEVHLKFRLKTETLYLTFNLIDRFLERVQVSRSKLQLVGVTCLLLASKYEEIYPPEVRDLVYVTDKAYTRTQILRMEGVIIRALDFRLTVPTHYKFLVRYIKAAQCDTRTKLIAYYFCEKCMPEFEMLGFKPSIIASAAVLLALKSQDASKQWSSTLEHYTKYTLEDITPCAQKIIGIVQQAEKSSSLQAIRKKYAQAKFGDAAGAAFRVKSL
jgi:cyclin B